MEKTMSALMGMMMAGLLATGTAPDMRVDARDLAMARPGDAAVLAQRIQAATNERHPENPMAQRLVPCPVQ